MTGYSSDMMIKTSKTIKYTGILAYLTLVKNQWNKTDISKLVSYLCYSQDAIR